MNYAEKNKKKFKASALSKSTWFSCETKKVIKKILWDSPFTQKKLLGFNLFFAMC
jgi:hypothetical protein